MLGDQPTLHMNDILHVLQEFTQMQSRENRCPKTIIQTKYQNGRIGHPILFSNHFFNDLKSLNGDVGGKEVIRENSQFLFQCWSANEYPEDIDTPNDYKRLLQQEKYLFGG